MYDHVEEMIQDICHGGFSKMKSGLKYSRTETIMNQVNCVVDLIYPCIQTCSILSSNDHLMVIEILENSRLRRKVVGIDEDFILDANLVYELTLSKQSCVVAMKRHLYLPFIIKFPYHHQGDFEKISLCWIHLCRRFAVDQIFLI